MSRFSYTIVITLALWLSVNLKAQINPLRNFIGVDITTAEKNDYNTAFLLGKQLGMNSVGIYQNWTALETSPEKYNMAVLDIANYYYPSYQTAVDLTVTPIHTNNLEVPADLVNTPFDNPTFINRFKKLLDSIKAHTPNLTLSSLVIGSEHDVYLGYNALLWSRYTTFYKAVSDHARTLWPGLKIATELTFDGLTTKNAFAQTLNAYSDYIGISYYPLNADFSVKPISVLPSDFATLVGLYPEKPLCFYQYGYPSSPACNSSEEQQAQFIAQTFASWDTYASSIRMIDFTWLHDLDTAAVNHYGKYYGITSKAFLEYLRTLGLRTWSGNGVDKTAFTELQCQAKARGYHHMAIDCSGPTSVDNSPADQVHTFTNLVQGETILEVPFDLKNSEIMMYNEWGQVVKIITSMSGGSIRLETSDLANGIYYLKLQNYQKAFNSKIIVQN